VKICKQISKLLHERLAHVDPAIICGVIKSAAGHATYSDSPTFKINVLSGRRCVIAMVFWESRVG
jgi:hypothetical protein